MQAHFHLQTREWGTDFTFCKVRDLERPGCPHPIPPRRSYLSTPLVRGLQGSREAQGSLLFLLLLSAQTGSLERQPQMQGISPTDAWGPTQTQGISPTDAWGSTQTQGIGTMGARHPTQL